jgi:hypothetical protein
LEIKLGLEPPLPVFPSVLVNVRIYHPLAGTTQVLYRVNCSLSAFLLALPGLVLSFCFSIEHLRLWACQDIAVKDTEVLALLLTVGCNTFAQFQIPKKDPSCRPSITRHVILSIPIVNSGQLWFPSLVRSLGLRIDRAKKSNQR